MEQDIVDSCKTDEKEYLVPDSGETPIVPALYLLPVPVSEGPVYDVLPRRIIELFAVIKHYIVENVREARRFLRRVFPDLNISDLTFYELNRHTDLTESALYLEPLRHGIPVGLMSDAGCPAVADPGSVIVEIAHNEGLKVVPLVGPSSIMLGLMASGFNGQGFTFHGYLPVKPQERTEMIRKLESQSMQLDMTQIFIETPYRNSVMLKSLINTLKPNTRVCVAQNLTHPMDEMIISNSVAEWRKFKPGAEFDRLPAIFLLYAGTHDFADTASGRKNAYRKLRWEKIR